MSLCNYSQHEKLEIYFYQISVFSKVLKMNATFVIDKTNIWWSAFEFDTENVTRYLTH